MIQELKVDLHGPEIAIVNGICAVARLSRAWSNDPGARVTLTEFRALPSAAASARGWIA
jgi:hypothetical protein